MSRPRQVLPGQFYELTRRCTQRQFLLRPDAETNNAFIYCLVEAALRYQIDILLPMAEANHHHTVIFDRYGREPQFLEHFHKMLAKCLNVRWGREENFWAAVEPCVTVLLDRESVIKEMVYAASNPVKDLLVERAEQWPGVNGYRELLSGKPLHARRPRYYFSDDGVMPPEVTLPLTIPTDLGPVDTVRAEVQAGVEAVEREKRELRARTGARILGRHRVRTQSWRDAPTSHRPRSSLRPRFAGGPAARIPALIGYKEFLTVYHDARKELLAGQRPMFPPGTYWLARFAAVSVAPLPA